MRTIKFLGLAVALAAVSVSANAQLGRRFDRSIGIGELARLEARQIERRQMPRFAMRGPMGMRGARLAGPRGRTMMMAGRMGQRMGFQHGRRAGMRLGARAGFHAGARANASPEQKELTRQFREKRQALRAQLQAGTLTRDQARAQMKTWTVEHRPKP